MADYIGRKQMIVITILAYSIKSGLSAASFNCLSFLPENALSVLWPSKIPSSLIRAVRENQRTGRWRARRGPPELPRL